MLSAGGVVGGAGLLSPGPGTVALALVCGSLSMGVTLVIGTEPSGSHWTRATVATRIDDRWLRRVGIGLCWSALVGALWAGVAGLVPPSIPVVVAGFVTVAAGVALVVPARTQQVLRHGVWLTVGGLLVAFVLTPLSTVALPDIGVLGRYTYLTTEVVFGVLALALLRWTGSDALRSAAVTVAMVYPLAYVWDWYTLTVGVFDIPLRTGLEVVGIPIEEHLFMIVVPALVLGVHETVRSLETESATHR